MGKRTCSVDGQEVIGPLRRGMCDNHYRRFMRTGDAQPGRPMRRLGIPVEERFWSKVARGAEDECWPWLERLSGTGYGLFNVRNGERGQVTASRFAYEITYGPIPEGEWIDHVCHNDDLSCPGGDSCPHRACCNPDHLDPVTPLENARRSHCHNAATTHCPQGHLYNEGNTAVGADGFRRCFICRRERERQRYQRKRVLLGRPYRSLV